MSEFWAYCELVITTSLYLNHHPEICLRLISVYLCECLYISLHIMYISECMYVASHP